MEASTVLKTGWLESQEAGVPVFGFRAWGIPARTAAAYGELEWTVLGEVPGVWQGVKGFCSVVVEKKKKSK